MYLGRIILLKWSAYPQNLSLSQKLLPLVLCLKKKISLRRCVCYIFWILREWKQSVYGSRVNWHGSQMPLWLLCCPKLCDVEKRLSLEWLAWLTFSAMTNRSLVLEATNLGTWAVSSSLVVESSQGLCSVVWDFQIRPQKLLSTDFWLAFPRSLRAKLKWW